MKTVKALAYSSSANLGPGFDILALCHDFGYDRVKVSLLDQESRALEIVSKQTPVIPEHNSAGRAALEILKIFDITAHIRIEIEKGIPLSAGLGGSGSSAVATVLALDSLLDLRLSIEDRVRIAGNSESSMPEGRHFDNSCASTTGSLGLVSTGDSLRVTVLPVHSSLRFLVAVPSAAELGSKTERMRAMTPSLISKNELIRNSASLGFLISGLSSGNPEHISIGMNDYIFEPRRSEAYPFFYKLKGAALEAGALGACLSGSGPSMLFVCNDDGIDEVRKSIAGFGKKTGININVKEVHVSGGAHIE